MKYVNLTPHDIHIQSGEKELVIPKSGKIARVSVKQEQVGEIMNGVPIMKNTYGNVENLPYPIAGTLFIVSSMVLQACKGRTDVIAPDTGPSAIRDKNGQIIAVTKFIINF